ncbi:hypothetical protein L202_02369 [Cryptococcus amylolentus CBS 6039]|uniref:PIN domain-containing protein n=1 Tax=Cryptococcus amylolentus CBS 6039 TaxID=1295533 RepID=A0A1E3I0D1_9TREE|nr:hypothetical protein L202_02369 [Cryptococcus amylolentus CBS 6039]ODN82049.1 hypothetical protein L202_02369 [Cryptococcus amylolentus CBS 6039]
MQDTIVAGPSVPRRRDDPVEPRQSALLVNGNRDERKPKIAPASPSAARPRTRPSSSRALRSDEYSRGSTGPSAPRVLFDPSKPIPPTMPAERVRTSERERSLHHPSSSLPRERSRSELEERSSDKDRDKERSRRRTESRRAESSSKTLFDPALHNPQTFTARPAHSNLLEPEIPKPVSRRLQPGVSQRASEMDADRERERRRRKEGSERGSAMSGKKKESDSKSKGSRSSEGSESFKDRERGKGRGDTGVKTMLKKIHDDIKDLEQELNDLHRRLSQDPEAAISSLSDKKMDAFSRAPQSTEDDTAVWVQLIAKHKQLAELHDYFLTTLYDPLVPSSYHQLSVKYNIPSRLWQTAFYYLLEQLRHAWLSNHPTALDLLTDVVYDAYRFYSELLENQTLVALRGAWIEALGDLARYRMTIASHVAEAEALRTARSKGKARQIEQDEQLDGEPISSGASIGAEVAQSWDVEDKETWRVTARDWYTMGLTEKPGEGRLHHHLALLCRDVKGQEGRALHHFVKSMIVTHAYTQTRENILPLFDSALQSQRSLPEATAIDLYLHLHGMIFTRISLDLFDDVKSRFMERLDEDASLDGVSRKATITQVDWMIMGVVNIACVLQYGASSGLIRKALAQEGAERRKAQVATVDEEEGEGDELAGNADVTPPASDDDSPPSTLTNALSLSFSVLSFVLAHPNRIQGFHQVLNPYITIFLTFLATIFRQPHVGASILLDVPWHLLAEFINATGLKVVEEKRLASGAPLPEDWLIRGSEWVGRRVYERGFWKGKTPSGRGSSGLAQPQPHAGGERFQSEMDVLLSSFDATVDIQEGVVDEAEGTDMTDGPQAVNQRRWKRVAWAVGVLGKHVDGFEIRDGKVYVEGVLEEKIEEAKRRKEEHDRKEHEMLEIKRQDREKEEELLRLEMDEGSSDDQELAGLRKKLQDLKAQASGVASISRKAKKAGTAALQVLAGYTMLVFDTNILLDSFNLVKSIVESGQWSVVIPLPVVTELDGLSKETGALGASARAAVALLEQLIRTHTLCLKVQTTKGNYLFDLLIRTEQIDASTYASDSQFARTMDDRIVHIASFAQDHFVDRSILLGMPKPEMEAAKVLLVSNDRNLRLKAKARGVEVASEKELQGVLARV